MVETELGTCVRAWRERLTPETIGLPARGARRTSGLRREEVAALAGVSVDYLVRLEQGRATNPSAQVVASLSRALALDTDERDHLYRLAGHAIPGAHRMPAVLTPSIERVVARLGDAAVCVNDPAGTILSWNPTWAALMGDPSVLVGRDRNLAWRHFVGARTRLTSVVRTDDETDDFDRVTVSDLRAAASRYPDDPDLHRLITDLLAKSPRFADLWATHDVTVRRAHHKTVVHPQVGPITIDCDVLRTEPAGVTLIVYTAAPGTPDAEKLDLVRVIGLQKMHA